MSDFAVQPMARMNGYAAIFDRVDQGRDSIAAGAFKRSLAGRTGMPLLWQHDAARPIGRIDALREDDNGLHVEALLCLGAAISRDAAALLAGRAVDGLSIGYRVRRATLDPRTRIRRLLEIDLLEVSLVTFPMQPHARVNRLQLVNPPAQEIARPQAGS